MITLKSMRQPHLRTLAAQGIAVRVRLKIRGLDVYEAIRETGDRVLIFSGAVIGPGWPSIHYVLETAKISFSIVDLGKPYFVAADSSQLREVLGSLWLVSKHGVRDEVFVNGEGFLSTELRKRFDARVLIAPIALLVFMVPIGASYLIQPEDKTTQEAKALTCALDLSDSEFQVWLKEQIVMREQTPAKQLVIQTELGVINLTVEQTLGSTQLISGTLECQDGRSIDLQFRTDAQSGGGFLDLGQELDP
jgi:hypothetical protein